MKLHLKNRKFFFALKAFFEENEKIFVSSNLFFDKKSGTYWCLMNSKRNICLNRSLAAAVINRAKFKVILN